MKNKAVKIGATSLVLALTFGALLYSTLAEGTEYYKHVDEVMTQPDQWYGKKLQLHGFVVPNSIYRKNATSLEHWFQVQTNGKIVSATYTGVVPDTFKSDSEVVLKGTLTADGFKVQPNGVMAKCPSKYEAKPGTASSVPSGTY
jgi:cytochrome c-type biogenesis protein CcmE